MRCRTCGAEPDSYCGETLVHRCAESRLVELLGQPDPWDPAQESLFAAESVSVLKIPNYSSTSRLRETA